MKREPKPECDRCGSTRGTLRSFEGVKWVERMTVEIVNGDDSTGGRSETRWRPFMVCGACWQRLRGRAVAKNREQP